MFQNFVYIIKGQNIKNKKTKYYIGFTNNLTKRIRKHNRIITGGAHATAGYTWSYFAIFANIPTMNIGLQIEWRLKNVLRLIKKEKNVWQKYMQKKTKLSAKTNIWTKINLFFAYIDFYLCPNKNRNEKLEKKLFCYTEFVNQLIVPKNIIIIQTEINDTIIEHINN